MANSIKGITVEIGGNTAPLQSALKDVDKTSRDVQSELKEVNKQLKFDPSNTTLLTQKQTLLKESISSTKDRLKTLKDAEKDVQEQFKQGKVSEEQYRALQREIISTENKLKGLQDQAGKSNAALSSISKVTGKVGSTATKIGKDIMPVSLGITALGAASIKAFDEVDSGADAVISKTGATGEAAKDLDKIYKEVASSVPDSFEEVSGAVGNVNVRLGLTGDKLKTASEDFLEFAKVNKTDITSSVELVSRAMGDAGIKSTDYKSVLDLLTTASQKSGITIENLTTNLAKYGAPMRALGVDTKTSIAMFAGWEKAGVNTEIAFSGMKKAISNWSAAGKDSKVEFSKTLEEIKKCPDISTATTKAIEVFGAKAGPDLADAIKGGRFEVSEYIKALDKAGGSVHNTYGDIVDGMDDGKTAMNAAKVAVSDLGGTILGQLSPILKDLAAKAREVAKMFAGMDDGTKETIVTVLEIVAIAGPILLVIGKVAGIISSITGAMTMLKTATFEQTVAQYGLNAALLANPITWVVIAIVALVAAFVVLWNKSEAFRKFWKDLWGGIKSVVKDVVGAVVDFFTKKIPDAWNKTVKFFKDIPKNVKKIWGDIKQTVVKKGTEIFNEHAKRWNNMVEFTKGLKNKFGKHVEDIWGKMKQTVSKKGGEIQNEHTGKWDQIVNFTKGLKSKFGKHIEDIWGKMKQTISKNDVEIHNKHTGSWNKTLDFLGGLPGEFIKKVRNIGKSIKDGFKEAIDFLKSLPKKALLWGEDFLKGFVKGMKKKFGAVGKAAKGVGEKIRGFLHFSVPDEGPLTDYETWMPDFMEGLAKGIENSKYLVTNAVKGLATDVNVGMELTTAGAAGINNTKSTASKEVSNSFMYGALLKVEHLTLNNDMDVQALSNKLEFYSQQNALNKGMK